MNTNEIDVAIIGAGTAGLFALDRVMKKTENFRLFEGGIEGTTCARIGCMPSKALIHVADAIHALRELPEMGVNVTAPKAAIDRKKIMQYVRKKRDLLVEHTIDGYKDLGDKIVRETAEFVAPMTLKAGAAIYTCKSIVIATGSTPVVPPGWRLEDKKIITTDTFFEQEDIPDDVLVVGMGFIGIEIGQALARMGVHVTGVEMLDAVAGLHDREIEKEVRDSVAKDVDIKLKTMALLNEVGEDVSVTLRNIETKKEEKRRFGLVILASGRKPRIESLRLERSGLPLTEKGMPIFNRETLQCGDMPVFIAGDVAGMKPLMHEAADEGIVAGLNAIAGGKLTKIARRVPLSITFTDPNACSIGKRLDELAPDSFVVAEGSYAFQGRAHVNGVYTGKIHIYLDKKTRKIVGAELAAPHGEHLAHLLASFMLADLTIDEATKLPYYHPTYEEGVATALYRALSKLK